MLLPWRGHWNLEVFRLNSSLNSWKSCFPTCWDSEAGITLSNEESGRHLRELVFIGSATAAILRMRSVAQADASLAGVLRVAAISLGKCCPRPRHTDHCFERQRLSRGAQGSTLTWGEPGQPPPCAIRAMHPRGQPLAYAVVYLAAAL